MSKPMNENSDPVTRDMAQAVLRMAGSKRRRSPEWIRASRAAEFAVKGGSDRCFWRALDALAGDPLMEKIVAKIMKVRQS